VNQVLLFGYIHGDENIGSNSSKGPFFLG